MRPAADREDPHDVDLQRDDRAGGKAHGEIEPKSRARIELCARLSLRVEDIGNRNFAGVVHCVSERSRSGVTG